MDHLQYFQQLHQQVGEVQEVILVMPVKQVLQEVQVEEVQEGVMVEQEIHHQ